ncbi:MAG: hypothetical protein VCC00_12580 [Deltaproteobacteria bacterium]
MMKKFSFLLLAAGMSLALAGPAFAHCGSCGVGGEKDTHQCPKNCGDTKDCECTSECGHDCPHHPAE